MKCLLLLALLNFSTALPLQDLTEEVFLNLDDFNATFKMPSDLIFGGSFATRGQFPWQAFLLLKKGSSNFICGGSLISPQHIVTAAHCTEGLDSGKAMLGLVDITTAYRTSGVQIKQLKSYRRASKYTGTGNLVDDIAIITLDSNVTLSFYVKTVTIKKDDSSIVDTPKNVVSGFGTYKFRGGVGITSDKLRYAEIDHIDHGACQRRWARLSGNRVRIVDTQICAGSRGKGSGPGDSGGPLQATVKGEAIQIGLVSFGVDGKREMQDQADYPVVYTRVSSYCDFMERGTDKRFKCQ
ncbi:hypothetical protein L596_030475 [Steinernema carpocapsae]|uniref:Peptidase S1 domain-containing protein n=1 Tax=Steinernema carpocapsae TaxID=34508 RepID=A0A4U5LPI9_STECR|nr:hypothetical protein L596_030475 [Steinernema carpocapsae]